MGAMVNRSLAVRVLLVFSSFCVGASILARFSRPVPRWATPANVVGLVCVIAALVVMVRRK
jgi:hypothetical protein